MAQVHSIDLQSVIITFEYTHNTHTHTLTNNQLHTLPFLIVCVYTTLHPLDETMNFGALLRQSASSQYIICVAQRNKAPAQIK